MFKINDFKLWGFTQGTQADMLKHKESLLFDKESAFKFMCSQESQKLHELNEDIRFYKNQAFAECHRVGKDNGDLLIEQFMDNAEL